MRKDSVILIAENDQAHFSLIKTTLQNAGINSEIIRLTDGRETLDFLFMKGRGPERLPNKEYLLLMDISLPKIDGLTVLEKIKRDPNLKKIPVIILTAADDQDTVERCHSLGCSVYIVKPPEHKTFVDTLRKIGLFLSDVQIPQLNGAAQTGTIK